MSVRERLLHNHSLVKAALGMCLSLAESQAKKLTTIGDTSLGYRNNSGITLSNNNIVEYDMIYVLE